MTRCARSGSPHNKKDHTDTTNSLPTLSTRGHHLRSPQRLLGSFVPNISGLEAEKPFQKLHTKNLHPLLPTYLGHYEVPTRVHQRTQSSDHSSLAGDIPGRDDLSDPPFLSLQSPSPLAQAPHPSTDSREDYSLVFSPLDPADCATGPSLDFHNFIPEATAMISC